MSVNTDYNNLDFLLNIYYDLVYHKIPEKNYRFESIARKHISLIDLKKPASFDASDIFQADMKYIGVRNNKIHFKRKSQTGYPCNISIGFYDNENLSNLNKGILYNVAMMYLISEIVITEKFKHSVLPVMLFDIDFNKLKKTIPNIEKYLLDIKINNNNTNKIAYCLITEHFFEMQSLREYLEKNAKNMSELQWKVLFFQVYYTLYKITDRLSQFRHNNLSLDSILIYTKNIDDTTTLYKVGDTKFNIPNMGFDIKFTDYDNSSTIDYIPNQSIKQCEYNDYYDVHYFTEYLRLWLRENSFDIPNSVLAFINEIVPDKIRDHNIKSTSQFTGLDESIDHGDSDSIKTIPVMILKKNNFFDEFIQTDQKGSGKEKYINNLMNMSASPIENPNISIKKIKNDSEFESSEYKRSVTESDSDGPRLLGRVVKSVNEPKKNKLLINKKSELNNNRMPKNFDNSKSNIRKNTKVILSDEENSISADSDIIHKADMHFKSKESKKKLKHNNDKNLQTVFSKNNKSKKSQSPTTEYSAFDNVNTQKSDDEKKYASYFKQLRKISRPNSNPEDTEISASASSASSASSESSVSSASDAASEKGLSESSESVSGTATFKKYMDALNKLDMSHLVNTDSEKQSNKKKHSSKHSSKHISRHSLEHSSVPSEDVISESSSEYGYKKSKKSKKPKSKGYEDYLGKEFKNKLQNIHENYVGEIPPHMAHMLPDENGMVYNPNDMEQSLNGNQPNAMASMLGFGGEQGMGGMPGMPPGMPGMGAGMEPPQGFFKNNQGSMGPMGNQMLGGPMQGPGPIPGPMQGPGPIPGPMQGPGPIPGPMPQAYDMQNMMQGAMQPNMDMLQGAMQPNMGMMQGAMQPNMGMMQGGGKKYKLKNQSNKDNKKFFF